MQVTLGVFRRYNAVERATKIVTVFSVPDSTARKIKIKEKVARLF